MGEVWGCLALWLLSIRYTTYSKGTLPYDILVRPCSQYVGDTRTTWLQVLLVLSPCVGPDQALLCVQRCTHQPPG